MSKKKDVARRRRALKHTKDYRAFLATPEGKAWLDSKRPNKPVEARNESQ